MVNKYLFFAVIRISKLYFPVVFWSFAMPSGLNGTLKMKILIFCNLNNFLWPPKSSGSQKDEKWKTFNFILDHQKSDLIKRPLQMDGSIT